MSTNDQLSAGTKASTFVTPELRALLEGLKANPDADLDEVLANLQDRHENTVAMLEDRVSELTADFNFMLSERDKWRDAARKAGVPELPKTIGKKGEFDMEVVRPAFEKWAAEFYDLAPDDFLRNVLGGYDNENVQARWMGWMHCSRLAPRYTFDPANAIGWYCYNRVTGKSKFTTSEHEAKTMETCNTGHWEVTALGAFGPPAQVSDANTEAWPAEEQRLSEADALELAAASNGTWRCRDCWGPLLEAHSENCGVGRGIITMADVGDSPIPNKEPVA